MTDVSPPKRERPLSPHLQIYRLPLAALTSIMHRMSGIALSAGAFVLVAWLWAAATRPDCFTAIQAALGSGLGMIAIAGWTFALFYHLCAGVRHLLWDAGVGFAKESYRFTNWVVIGAALVMTGCTLLKLSPLFMRAFGVTP